MPDQTGLWDFALRYYRAAGVAAACLDLQDRHGADVPLLIFGAWVGARRGVALTQADVQAAARAVADWHAQIVRPLRAVRRVMKSGPPPAPDAATEALRETIKAVEIGAEKIELSVLAGLAPPPGIQPPETATRANLTAILTLSASGDLPRTAITALDILVQAATLLSHPPTGPDPKGDSA
jgi:uncharacterized protein (TIGR02444 family)